MSLVLTFEFLLVAAIIYMFVSQVMEPLISGKRMFPIVRGRDAALDEALARADEQVQEAEIERRVQERLIEMKRTKHSASGQTHSPSTRGR